MLLLIRYQRARLPITPHPGPSPLSAMPPPASISFVPLSCVSGTTPSLPPPTDSLVLMAGTPQGLPPVTQSSLMPGSGIPDWLLPSSDGGMSLSISTRPVPARIVQQIRAGRFIEMRDLLGDNAAVRHHFEELHGAMGMHILPVTSRPRVREVNSLPAWIGCFLTYLAVSTSDLTTRDRLTYAVLLIREAMHHGGHGWMEYDRLFRQQAVINLGLRWNVIHPGLQATTILGQWPSGAGTYCVTCQECDHVASQCALTQLQQPSLQSNSSSQSSARNSSQAGTSSRTPARICNSWNDGACAYPGNCTYRHICTLCFCASHPAKDCHLRLKVGPNPRSARAGDSVPRSSAS